MHWHKHSAYCGTIQSTLACMQRLTFSERQCLLRGVYMTTKTSQRSFVGLCIDSASTEYNVPPEASAGIAMGWVSE